eukprot:TRINITY_DN1681_c0_g1_i1.p1 TRINITY_DN1681_c0_g1~~TRINITY_DN1681_c0_g1_i1.p1  ORF type:complete len:495 (+),score=155.05 TRINITY_DN1681_c0_g1_i1:30-1514(+)
MSSEDERLKKEEEELQNEEERLKNQASTDETRRKEEEDREARRLRVQQRREQLTKMAEERRKQSSSSVSEETSSSAIREDVVNSCVNFLNHPKVKSAPLSEKMAFFRKKGLTDEEIQLALTRAGVSQNGTTTSQSSLSPAAPPAVPLPPSYPPSNLPGTPMQPYVPNVPYPSQQLGYPLPPPQKQSWYNGSLGLAVTAASCISVGVGLAFVAKKFIQPLLYGSQETDSTKRALEIREKEEEDRKANLKILEEMKDVIKAMQVQQTDMKDYMKGVLDQSAPKHNGEGDEKKITKLMSRVSEMDAEIKKLRSMAVDNKTTSGNSTNISTTPSWTPSPKASIPTWQREAREKREAESLASRRDDPYSKMQQQHHIGSQGNGNLSGSNINSANSSSSSAAAETQTRNGSFGGDEPRPHGMQKIMEMLANGQKPDDIQDIDDKPINPNNERIEKGSLEPKLKPWQKKANNGPADPQSLTEEMGSQESSEEKDSKREMQE